MVLAEVEKAIPALYLYDLNDDALPTAPDTCAALGTRIYVLDRMVRPYLGPI